MATVKDALDLAYRRWFTTGMHYTIGVVKRDWLQGPRPGKLGVITGNLRNRVAGRLLNDGFAVGTNVKYGIYWEKGIKAHRVTAKPGKVLAIPMKTTRITRTGKQRTLKKMIFVKSVFIPDQAPRKWLEPGINAAMPMIHKIGIEEMSKVILSFPNRIVGGK